MIQAGNLAWVGTFGSPPHSTSAQGRWGKLTRGPSICNLLPLAALGSAGHRSTLGPPRQTLPRRHPPDSSPPSSPLPETQKNSRGFGNTLDINSNYSNNSIPCPLICSFSYPRYHQVNRSLTLRHHSPCLRHPPHLVFQVGLLSSPETPGLKEANLTLASEWHRNPATTLLPAAQLCMFG